MPLIVILPRGLELGLERGQLGLPLVPPRLVSRQRALRVLEGLPLCFEAAAVVLVGGLVPFELRSGLGHVGQLLAGGGEALSFVFQNLPLGVQRAALGGQLVADGRKGGVLLPGQALQTLDGGLPLAFDFRPLRVDILPRLRERLLVCVELVGARRQLLPLLGDVAQLLFDLGRLPGLEMFERHVRDGNHGGSRCVAIGWRR
jgi:hypothetical protein